MRYIIVILLLTSVSGAAEITIIPQPNKVEKRTGTFTFNAETVIVADGPGPDRSLNICAIN